jgi:hypothetical protein
LAPGQCLVWLLVSPAWSIGCKASSPPTLGFGAWARFKVCTISITVGDLEACCCNALFWWVNVNFRIIKIISLN